MKKYGFIFLSFMLAPLHGIVAMEMVQTDEPQRLSNNNNNNDHTQQLAHINYDDSRQVWPNLISFLFHEGVFADKNKSQAMALVFSPNGKYFVFGGSNDVIIRSTQDWSVVHEIEETGVKSISCIAVSPNNNYFAYSNGWDKIQLLSTADWSELESFNYKADAIAFSSDSNYIVGARNRGNAKGVIYKWAIGHNKKEPIDSFDHTMSQLTSIRFISNDHFVVLGYKFQEGGRHSIACILDSAAPGEVKEVCSHSDILRDVSVSHDGTHIASGGFDKKIVLSKLRQPFAFDTADSREFNYSNEAFTALFAIAFSPHDDYIAYGGNGESDIVIRSLKDTNYAIKKSYQLGNQKQGFGTNELAFSPDGNLLAAGSYSSTAILDAFILLLDEKKKKAINTLRKYIFAKTIANKQKDEFYLNADGYNTWQQLKIRKEGSDEQEEHVYADEFTLYRPQASLNKDPAEVPVWKLARNSYGS